VKDENPQSHCFFFQHHLHTPHEPPFWAQCLQCLQVLQAVQLRDPLQVAVGLFTTKATVVKKSVNTNNGRNCFIKEACLGL